jgi:hypothetical protein
VAPGIGLRVSEIVEADVPGLEAGTITSYWPAGEKDGDSHVGVDVTGVRLQAVSWLVMAPSGPVLQSGMDPSPMVDLLAPT